VEVRLFIISMTLLIAAGFVIYRKANAAAGKFSLAKLVQRLKEGSVSPAQIAEALDIPYHKIQNVSETAYSSLAEKIKEGMYLSNYRIMYSCLIDKGQLLVLTELPFSDFDIDITGRASDVKNKAYHNFLVKYDTIKSEVSVVSTLYKDTTDKFQKQEFLKSM
jgi:hypothetical protein